MAEIFSEEINLDKLDNISVIDINETPSNSNRPPVNFGAGIELLMNDKKKPGSKRLGDSIDIADQLSAMLSDEISKGIDKEILKSMGIYSRNVRRMNSISKIFFKNVE